MEITMILCAAVIAVCIALNKFFYRFGIPAILIFMGVGMLFGSEGLVKIPFSDYETAEVICSTALVFIMFYGGFGTSFTAARPILTKGDLPLHSRCGDDCRHHGSLLPLHPGNEPKGRAAHRRSD